MLADLPDPSVAGSQLTDAEVDLLAVRLEEAHNLLVHALEAVEKGPAGGSAGSAVPGR